MNEVKKIHLGRQPFTISVDAHKALQEYLHAIEKQVGKESDVLKEVELRMAELLGERGITEEKVVLPEDVTFLKGQLGAPHDFKDDEPGEERTAADQSEGEDKGPKRLYRDPEHSIIAGVAAGMAAYFRVDPIIFRLLFVVLTFSGGIGVALYILLWILVPEATTPSAKLQMRGKAVTVESIKKTVGRAAERADLPGAANRAGKLLRDTLNIIGRLILLAIGALLTTFGTALFVWTTVVGTYLLIHGAAAGSEVIFPVGSRAVWGVISAMLAFGALALALLAAGIAIYRRKWTAPGWVLATMIGVFFLASSVATAIGFAIQTEVRDRYRRTQHTHVIELEPFSVANLKGKHVDFVFEPGNDYSVEVQYFGKPQDTSGITTKVEGDLLTVDTSKFELTGDSCAFPCLIHTGEGLRVIVHAPALTDVDFGGDNTTFEAPGDAMPRLDVEREATPVQR